MTGALRDMLQSHLLQVLAIAAMPPPSTLEQLEVRDSKAHILRATRVWDDRPSGSAAAPATPPARSTAVPSPRTSTRRASTPPGDGDPG
ncbi:hypothetical protein ACR6C2_25030 [Streptomyces sp. INA 01156]